jgi:Cd2+/Zn2+-exporting ATPase
MKLPFHDKKFVFLLSAVGFTVGLEILSLLGTDIPLPYAPFVYAALILGLGREVLRKGLAALVRLQFNSINLLMLIAVCAAFYLGEYAEAAVVIVLYVLGEQLEDIGIDNSRSALEALIRHSPKTAVLGVTGEELPVEQIAVGTVIRIKPHDAIPLDGVVESGETTVDESTITGEPIPNEKTAGDTVFAGTLNQSGFIEVRTTKLSADTTLSRIVEQTCHAGQNKSNVQNFIQKFARIYTPSIIVLALALFVVPVFVFGADLNRWLHQAVTLLVISCPCALVISTPVAVYAAIGNASSKGALVKGGKYLEALSGVKAIGMDKTRTITCGKPVVSDVIPLGSAGKEELLACAAGTERFSEHPLAQAIVDASLREGFRPHAARRFESVAGKGARAVCDDCDRQIVLVGRLKYIEQHQSVPPETKEVTERLSKEGKTCVVVSCRQEIKGVIALTDEIKPDSAEAIRQLQALGVEPVMITGDNRRAADHVAQQTGIRNVYGELLPQDKASIIQTLQSRYRSVAMVGDGVNDAPALAQSTVGIAMGAAGSDTAIEAADIALMNDKLTLIPFLIRLSRKTVRTIRRNTICAVLIKILFILLATAGFSNLAMAIAADVGVTLAVILVSLRLMQYRDN